MEERCSVSVFLTALRGNGVASPLTATYGGRGVSNLSFPTAPNYLGEGSSSTVVMSGLLRKTSRFRARSNALYADRFVVLLSDGCLYSLPESLSTLCSSSSARSDHSLVEQLTNYFQEGGDASPSSSSPFVGERGRSTSVTQVVGRITLVGTLLKEENFDDVHGFVIATSPSLLPPTSFTDHATTMGRKSSQPSDHHNSFSIAAESGGASFLLSGNPSSLSNNNSTSFLHHHPSTPSSVTTNSVPTAAALNGGPGEVRFIAPDASSKRRWLWAITQSQSLLIGGDGMGGLGSPAAHGRTFSTASSLSPGVNSLAGTLSATIPAQANAGLIPLVEGILEKRYDGALGKYQPRHCALYSQRGLVYRKVAAGSTATNDRGKTLIVQGAILSLNPEKFRFGVAPKGCGEKSTIYFRCPDELTFVRWASAMSREASNDPAQQYAQGEGSPTSRRGGGGDDITTPVRQKLLLSGSESGATQPEEEDSGAASPRILLPSALEGFESAIQWQQEITAEMCHFSTVPEENDDRLEEYEEATRSAALSLGDAGMLPADTLVELCDLASPVPLTSVEIHRLLTLRSMLPRQQQSKPIFLTRPEPQYLAAIDADGSCQLESVCRAYIPPRSSEIEPHFPNESNTSTTRLYSPTKVERRQIKQELQECLQSFFPHGLPAAMEQLDHRMFLGLSKASYSELNSHIVLLDLDVQKLRDCLVALVDHFGGGGPQASSDEVRDTMRHIDVVLRSYVVVRESLGTLRSIATFREQKDLHGLKMGVNGSLEFVQRLTRKKREAPSETNWRKVYHLYSSLYECLEAFRNEFDVFEESAQTIFDMEGALAATHEWLAVQEPLVAWGDASTA